jgi:hypothetical protein
MTDRGRGKAVRRSGNRVAVNTKGRKRQSLKLYNCFEFEVFISKL